MKKVTEWYNRARREQEEHDIEMAVRSVLNTASKLPYEKQIEILKGVKSNLESRKDSFLNEADEIDVCLEKIKEL